MAILIAADFDAAAWAVWSARCRRRCPASGCCASAAGAAAEIDVALVANPPPGALRRLPRAAPDPVAVGRRRPAAGRPHPAARRADRAHGRPGDERGDGRDRAVGRALAAPRLLRLRGAAAPRRVARAAAAARRRGPRAVLGLGQMGRSVAPPAGAERLSRARLEHAADGAGRHRDTARRRGAAARCSATRRSSSTCCR